MAAVRDTKSTVRKTKRKKTEPTYARYIYKVFKQVHPDLGISSSSILATNGIAQDLIGRMIKQSTAVAKEGKKSTLSSKHVQAATRIVMPFELAKHAVSEGTKAVVKFAA